MPVVTTISRVPPSARSVQPRSSYDDELNSLVGLDGRTKAVTHLTLLGHGV